MEISNLMKSSAKSININDYKILEKIDLGKIPKQNDYRLHSFRAIDKKSKKEVAINIYEDYFDIDGKIEDIIPKPNLFKLKGTVNVIQYQSPMTIKNKNEIKNLLEYYYPDNHYTLFITELMKIQRIENLNSDYIQSKGEKHNQINPTIRSKIIFGIAATMKKLHSMNTYLPDFFGNVCLDENLEPRLKLSSMNYFDLSKVKLRYIYLWEVGDELRISPPEKQNPEKCDPSLFDVFGFGMFLYSMFTDTTDEKDFLDRFLLSNKYFYENYRPIKNADIPDHYFDLIEKCCDKDPNKRPTFDEIVEILKSDKFALNEFSMITNIDELHEYQIRIDSDEENY